MSTSSPQHRPPGSKAAAAAAELTPRAAAASELTVHPSGPLRGHCRVPGDKSISHRAVMLGALASGPSSIRGFLHGGDCYSTIGVLRALGCTIELGDTSSGSDRTDELRIHGRGLHGLVEPTQVLDCGNSGTTLRLLLGVLAGQSFASFVTGSPQLLRRPMERVVTPLRQLGAQILGRQGGRFAPLALAGSAQAPLHQLEYTLPVASAQVKSCLLLASLYASGEVIVNEPIKTRDHTERMLRSMGAEVQRQQTRIHIAKKSGLVLQPLDLRVPGDISSAAFVLVAAAITPGSELTLSDVGVNPTRDGIVQTLREMGMTITLQNQREVAGEPVADLVVKAQPLRAIELAGPRVVTMIDELPVLAVAATQAHGRTHIRDARELRVKETDRIATTVAALRQLGAQIEATDDGFVIDGPTPLQGARVHSQRDHRLAMALTVAGLCATGQTVVTGAEVTADSFPGFAEVLRSLGAQLSASGPVVTASYGTDD